MLTNHHKVTSFCSYPQRLGSLLVDLGIPQLYSGSHYLVPLVDTLDGVEQAAGWWSVLPFVPPCDMLRHRARHLSHGTARPMAQWCRTTSPSTCRPTPKFGRHRDLWANRLGKSPWPGSISECGHPWIVTRLTSYCSSLGGSFSIVCLCVWANSFLPEISRYADLMILNHVDYVIRTYYMYMYSDVDDVGMCLCMYVHICAYALWTC